MPDDESLSFGRVASCHCQGWHTLFWRFVLNGSISVSLAHSLVEWDRCKINSTPPSSKSQDGALHGQLCIGASFIRNSPQSVYFALRSLLRGVRAQQIFLKHPERQSDSTSLPTPQIGNKGSCSNCEFVGNFTV